ncbi:TOBE domain-containing protein [Gloeothece citriformis]|uniref:TOBE domain-containing protein n=1 Tax=Gloeothece citriformis TaxID=2546356 RepID=UPI000173B82D|nr:TOBE domain-containing protein [Gloeothece citriformis]
MNLLPLHCQQKCALLGEYQIPLPTLNDPIDHVVLGIRPEDIIIEAGNDAYTVEGKVYLEEGLGKEKLISVTVKGSQYTIRALVSAEEDWEGKTVKLRLPSQQIHWFSWNGNPEHPLNQRERLN